MIGVPLEDVVQQAVVDDAHVRALELGDENVVLVGSKGNVVQADCRFSFWYRKAWNCLEKIEKLKETLLFREERAL